MRYERQLYPPLTGHFCEDYEIFEEIRPYPEFREYTKSIDLVLRNRKSRKLTAVEVKLNDWVRAMRQSLLNTCYCHYSYVALPQCVAERLDAKIFEDNGIGLISVRRKEVEILVRAMHAKPVKRVENALLCSVQRTRR